MAWRMVKFQTSMIKNIEYFFNVKFSITIIWFKFSEKYLLTSNEVEK